MTGKVGQSAGATYLIVNKDTDAKPISWKQTLGGLSAHQAKSGSFVFGAGDQQEQNRALGLVLPLAVSQATTFFQAHTACDIWARLWDASMPANPGWASFPGDPGLPLVDFVLWLSELSSFSFLLDLKYMECMCLAPSSYIWTSVFLITICQ